MLDLSKVWPEWTAEEKLGEGAYGSVYKCVRRERGITSYCAIKVITVPHDSSELDSLKLEGYTDETSKEYFNDIVDNFVNEISVMENLKGLPNIVSVEDFKIVEHADNVGWDIYIRMELLTSFKRYLENHAMTQNEVLKFGTDICAALEICEENRIIHRDIKEDNIFVDKRGNFKLGDFGIAKQLERTRSATSHVGAYAYMAPEVPINGRCDKRADIYSLGIVMYKLLNKNRDPFLDTEKQMIRFQERVDAVNRRLDGEALPKPVNADDAVAEIILKACKFNKEERFSSATEMKSAIENILAPKKEPEVPEEKVQTTIQEEITEEVKHENKTKFIKISEIQPENVAYSDDKIPDNKSKKDKKSNGFLKQIKAKKFPLVIALCIVVVASAVCGWYFSTHGSCGENVKWKLSADGTLTISGSGDMYDFSFGNDLAPWRLKAKSVIVEEGVTSIGDGAFRQAFNITDVSIPSTVTRIGALAFQWCSIETLTLPDALTYIGGRAFENCENLKTINIPKNVTHIGVSIFSGCTSLETLYFDAINCEQIASIEDENYLGSSAQLFDWGGDAENIIIGSEVKIIPDRAFKYSEKLNSIVIPQSVVVIGEEAFNGCSNLTNVYYPGTMEQWNKIETEDGNYILDEIAIHYNSQGTAGNMTSTIINRGECGEGVNWFLYENGELVIKGNGTMDDWASEENVFSPWSAYSEKIITVTIGQGITNISENSFNGCINLETISIGKDVTLIDSDSFSNCTKLKEITIPASVTDIIYGAFKNCSSLEKINVEDGNLYYSSDKHGVLFYNKTELVQYPIGNKRNTYVIPDGVTDIRPYAFYGCQNLESIVFSDDILYIWDYAFKDCVNLKEIDFHFWWFLAGYHESNYGYIGDYAFSGCKKLTMDILWMDFAWHIGSYAFDGCTGIKELYIGEATEEIGAYAFNGWTSQQDIYIIGTSDNWKSGWDAGCNAAFPHFHG